MSTPRYRSDPPSLSGSAISVWKATTPSSPDLNSSAISPPLASTTEGLRIRIAGSGLRYGRPHERQRLRATLGRRAGQAAVHLAPLADRPPGRQREAGSVAVRGTAGSVELPAAHPLRQRGDDRRAGREAAAAYAGRLT